MIMHLDMFSLNLIAMASPCRPSCASPPPQAHLAELRQFQSAVAFIKSTTPSAVLFEREPSPGTVMRLFKRLFASCLSGPPPVRPVPGPFLPSGVGICYESVPCCPFGHLRRTQTPNLKPQATQPQHLIPTSQEREAPEPGARELFTVVEGGRIRRGRIWVRSDASFFVLQVEVMGQTKAVPPHAATPKVGRRHRKRSGAKSARGRGASECCRRDVGKFTTDSNENGLKNMFNAFKYMIEYLYPNKMKSRLISETPAGVGTELLRSIHAHEEEEEEEILGVRGTPAWSDERFMSSIGGDGCGLGVRASVVKGHGGEVGASEEMGGTEWAGEGAGQVPGTGVGEGEGVDKATAAREEGGRKEGAEHVVGNPREGNELSEARRRAVKEELRSLGMDLDEMLTGTVYEGTVSAPYRRRLFFIDFLSPAPQSLAPKP